MSSREAKTLSLARLMASSVENDRFLVMTRCCWFFGVFLVMFFSRDSIVGLLSSSPLLVMTALTPLELVAGTPALLLIPCGLPDARFLRA